MSGPLDISLGRRNIALFALVTAFFGAAKIGCPSSLRRVRSGANFSSNHQRLRVHFCGSKAPWIPLLLGVSGTKTRNARHRGLCGH